MKEPRPSKYESSGGGGVQEGGRPRAAHAPNTRPSLADGSKLARWDPFNIRHRHEKKLAVEQAKRQASADAKNAMELCAKKREKQKLREEAEAAEIAEERALKANEAKSAADSFIEMTDAHAHATEAEAELEAEMQAEMASDAEAAAEQDAEAERDAAESAADFAERQVDILYAAESSDDQRIEAEHRAMIETQHVHTPFVESSRAPKPSPPRFVEKATLPQSSRASLPVTYGREDIIEESFRNNGHPRSVFARRARGQEIVRFERAVASSGGQAVNGVTKMPCGKDITDAGLFAAVIGTNLQATVEAANPSPPVWRDDNIVAITKLPVVPMFKEAQVADEYGDMPKK